MAHKRQSRPEIGRGFHVKVLKNFQVVPTAIGSGPVDLYNVKHFLKRGRETCVLGLGGGPKVQGLELSGSGFWN